RSAAPATGAGPKLKNLRNVRGLASRMGTTVPATPFLMPTTTVNCSPAGRVRVALNIACFDVDALRQASRDPSRPWKQLIHRRPSAGTATVALASVIGTAHCRPV